ncbi:protein of unknown function [Caulobacter sp. UNC279MFTsu5.1]|nr:protein of unknown function [Caulobacter sp. UNC279MFTsu5.1]
MTLLTGTNIVQEFNWTCPHCHHAQVVTENRFSQNFRELDISGYRDGRLGLGWRAIICANNLCRELTLSVNVQKATSGPNYTDIPVVGSTPRLVRRLIPEAASKPQPDFIPAPLREDYREACAIVDLSPKAAATLARRCLQGMIRDFCKISKRTLDLEIKALREAVDAGQAPSGVTHEAVDAIDHVRKLGNIGAHMEKDINVIVPVDAGEAGILLQLIEMLFEEWYVARHARITRLAQISMIAAEKEAARLEPAVTQMLIAPPEAEPG